MSFAKKVGYGVWAAAMVVLVARSELSAANNFKASAQNKGCRSILTEDGRKQCDEVQGEKNRQCNVATSCEVRDHERLLTEYKEARQRFIDKVYAKTDEDKVKDNLRALKTRLENSKSAATTGVTVANACIKARDAVQTWFEKTAIPLTDNLRNTALAERKGLLEKLEEAKKKKEDAKRRLEANRADLQAERDLEESRKLIEAAENALAAFNNKYGEDVSYFADQLIRHYNDEKTNHDTPSKQAENRLESCKKIEGLGIGDSLPF